MRQQLQPPEVRQRAGAQTQQEQTRPRLPGQRQHVRRKSPRPAALDQRQRQEEERTQGRDDGDDDIGRVARRQPLAAHAVNGAEKARRQHQQIAGQPTPANVRWPAPWLTIAAPTKAAASAPHSTPVSRSPSQTVPMSTRKTGMKLDSTPAFVAVV